MTTAPAARPSQPRRMRWVVGGLLLATLLAWGPLLSVLFTMAMAGALGCRVDEAAAYPCPGPFGTEWGELLYFTGMMGWLMLATLPFMLATALGWALLALRGLWRRLRRR